MEDRRVAVVGGGVSGLAAAYHLHQTQGQEVLVFESENRLGGHAHTVHVETGLDPNTAGVDVDVGFMVFNEDNYPNMVKWFEELEVPYEDTDMSLSISLDQGGMEWSSDGLSGLFANRSQIVKPSFYSFIKEMLRFNENGPLLLGLDPDDPRRAVTLGQYLRDEGYSDAFATHYLLPMMAALWSASMEDVLQFPAEQLMAFFCNHKLLQIFDRPIVSILFISLYIEYIYIYYIISIE
jgi:predicted NAD/FAD-binding protein